MYFKDIPNCTQVEIVLLALKLLQKHIAKSWNTGEVGVPLQGPSCLQFSKAIFV